MDSSLLVFSPTFDSIIVYIVLSVSLIGIILLFVHRWKENSELDNVSNNDEKNHFLIKKGKRNQSGINSQMNFNVDLKLQAYERLTIFLSRIDPWRLLSLVRISEKNIKVIEDSLLKIIISEFEYNLSQQVYVSDNLWELIETSKNKTIQLILSVKINLKKNANGQDFYNSLENILKNQNVTPSKITLNYLKKEFRSI
tara:strand:+ start:57 stop:650 length:594 start_codon:yes stop_codon:yes gene_type:complete